MKQMNQVEPTWTAVMRVAKQFESQIEIFLSSRFSTPGNEDEVSEVVRQMRERIKAAYPTPISQWSWNVDRTLSSHILIRLRSKIVEPASTIPIVWSQEKNTIWEFKSLDKFLKIVEIERMNLADNLEDILEIFFFFQTEKRILRDNAILQTPMFEVYNNKLALLPKYMKLINPLTYSNEGGRQKVEFWTIDISSGDLEGWLFIQDRQGFEVQPWIKEKEFIKPVMRY